ncbi:hypothetical protein CVT26_013146 [Gymnopilus dilepis]|uniref:DUF6534 domain-containing protein n=1 Tax=Gymnopilus dilepis TaxID=231916 RepID=A0A409WUV3_9AGAR|nr:hypothetical protein CVT26_013146 [Gymnopilus dilepis]
MFQLILLPRFQLFQTVGLGHWSLVFIRESSAAARNLRNWTLSFKSKVSVLLNTLIACIVQIIYHLSQNKMRWWLTSIIVSPNRTMFYRSLLEPLQGVAVVLHFGFGMETVTLMLIKKEFSKLTQINFYAATPFAIFAVLSDFMITGALIYLLHGHRTSFRKTNTLVSKLIVYAINRCLLTAIVEIAECIVFSTLTESLWFLAIDFVIGKLYANSLLATLNSRRMLTPRHKSTVGSVHLSRLDFRSSREGGSRPTIEISNEMMDQDSGGIRMTEIIVVSKGGELENGVLTPPNTKEKE